MTALTFPLAGRFCFSAPCFFLSVQMHWSQLPSDFLVQRLLPGRQVFQDHLLFPSSKSNLCSREATFGLTCFSCSFVLKFVSGNRGGATATKASILSSDLVLKTLAPLCGLLVSIAMFSSPLPAVLKAQKDGALGELNLQPYPAQCGNCAAWLTYALLVKVHLHFI